MLRSRGIAEQFFAFRGNSTVAVGKSYQKPGQGVSEQQKPHRAACYVAQEPGFAYALKTGICIPEQFGQVENVLEN